MQREQSIRLNLQKFALFKIWSGIKIIVLFLINLRSKSAENINVYTV